MPQIFSFLINDPHTSVFHTSDILSYYCVSVVIVIFHKQHIKCVFSEMHFFKFIPLLVSYLTSDCLFNAYKIVINNRRGMEKQQLMDALTQNVIKSLVVL